MQYLAIREEEESVVSITAKVRQSFGNKSLILVQANGFKMEDTDTTRGKFYLKDLTYWNVSFLTSVIYHFIYIFSCP